MNAEFKQRKCYNLRDDYDDKGNLKKDAKAKIRGNEVIEDLNKATVIDSPHDKDHPNPNHFEDGLADLKAYIKKVKAYCD